MSSPRTNPSREPELDYLSHCQTLDYHNSGLTTTTNILFRKDMIFISFGHFNMKDEETRTLSFNNQKSKFVFLPESKF
jgi:hypothetical protein